MVTMKTGIRLKRGWIRAIKDRARSLSSILARTALIITLIVSVLFGILPGPASAERIKDFASFEGVRENQLIGYGLVTGLNGAGDTSNATLQSIGNVLLKMGLAVKMTDIKTKDTAAVMVTATLPPFPKPGTKIDVNVSCLGEAKTLQGGTLLMAPLKGPDGKVYALAQGPVSIGGFIGGGGGTSVQKNHPTSGLVPEGAVIEAEPHFSLPLYGDLRLFLNRPDFTTATATAKKINEALAGDFAATVDPSTVKLRIPPAYGGKPVDLISFVETLEVSVDVPARVVINERTGTVVIGESVTLSPVAIAHGNLTIEIKTDYKVSQPPPFAPQGAQTVVTPDQRVSVNEQKASLVEVAGVTLGDIVRALNALGVTPRDLISILQALRAAGALHAQLEII